MIQQFENANCPLIYIIRIEGEKQQKYTLPENIKFICTGAKQVKKLNEASRHDVSEA